MHRVHGLCGWYSNAYVHRKQAKEAWLLTTGRHLGFNRHTWDQQYDSYELNATTEGHNLFWRKRVKNRGGGERGWWEINIGQLHQKAIDAHEKNGVCFLAIIEQTSYLATYKGRMSEIYTALPNPSLQLLCGLLWTFSAWLYSLPYPIHRLSASSVLDLEARGWWWWWYPSSHVWLLVLLWARSFHFFTTCTTSLNSSMLWA